MLKTIDIIDAKIVEIDNKIKKENKQIVHTNKQCASVGKNLIKGQKIKK